MKLNRFSWQLGISLNFFLLFIITHQLFSQPIEYANRGVKPLLVNYGAIRGDAFLARFAAERFYFIDEGSLTDIKLIRKYFPNKPISLYKDIIALHTTHEEFKDVDKDEFAFLHSSEPSSLIFHSDSGGCLFWKPDGRIGQLAIIGYRIYYANDSLGDYNLVTNEIVSSELKIPKLKTGMINGNYIKVVSVLQDSTEINYGMPTKKLTLDNTLPVLLPVVIKQTASSDTNIIEIAFEIIGKIIPDSVLISIDINRNKQYSSSEVFKMKIEGTSVLFNYKVPKPARSYGGYAFQLRAYYKGKAYYYPGTEGYEKPLYHYSTNINNRLKNDYYGFYVMNVASSTWVNSYITQILNKFSKVGYNCLFEDDCIFQVSSWVVDALTGIDYDNNTWKNSLYLFMDSIRTAISPRKAYYNGLYAWGSDSLLLHSDGGMTEGFACMHWQPYYAPLNTWKLQCNLGLAAQNNYKKEWMALGGIFNDDPKARMYVLCSYLLVSGELSMLGNANNYQEFAHYPEFDIPLGKPLDSAVKDIDELRYFYSNDSIAYYRRNFEQGFVVVNPNKDKFVVIKDIEGYTSPFSDTLSTIEGGRLSTYPSTDTIFPQSACIYLKPAPKGNRLASPFVQSIVVDYRMKEDKSIEGTIRVVACDSSSDTYKSTPDKPLYVRAFLGELGGPRELVLKNDGTPANTEFSEYSADFTLPVGITAVQDSFPVLVYSTTGLAVVGKGILKIKAADSSNFVRNFSFEIDNNEDNIPDAWKPYVKGFEYDTSGANAKSGTRSVYCKNDSLTEFRGIYISIPINQEKPEELKLSGWSKCNNVSGSKDNDYSLYVDCIYNDNTPLYGQTAQFSTGTHDWEYSEKIIKPEKPIKSLNLYALFRKHTGEVWFDHISLEKYIPSDISNTSPNIRCFDLDINSNPGGENSYAVLTAFDEGKYEFSIFDLLGRKISSFSKYCIPNSKHYIKICDITNNKFHTQFGVYLIKIKSPCGEQVKKVLLF
jgi:hypothetical protein